ncbi:hypothetical protein EV197_0214 [Aquimarina brevivitae]|uniref:Uncharacterized protein n=1 Tax=Aquimarina brevivitae TaxID=323412 RepID=A0A4Q7PJC6_9FLAO|nr:hypothetical protein EV197_0214 [Aquimarina brevivitae]
MRGFFMRYVFQYSIDLIIECVFPQGFGATQGTTTSQFIVSFFVYVEEK